MGNGPARSERETPASGGPARTAERVDAATGAREIVGYLPATDGEIFAATHLPPGPPSGAVVICPPLFDDFAGNYFREVQLARALTTRGVAAQRFHYRGTGNSDGDPVAVTWGRLLADARLAAQHLAAATQGAPPAFVGTRLGALVAAELAAASPGAPLALWEPTTDADRFLKEALRSQAMSDVVGGDGGARPSTAALLDELASAGSVDVLGYRMPAALFDGRTLRGALGAAPRPVLLVQFQRSGALAAELEKLSAALGGDGFAVESMAAALVESWWFRTEKLLPADEQVDRTAEWLARALRPAVPAP